MSKKSEFNWYNYYEVGVELLDSKNDAKLRTAIGRFYYSAFLQTRDFLDENKYYCNKTLKSNFKSKTGKVHGATIDICKYDKRLNSGSSKGKKLSRKLDYLKRCRRDVDYNLKNPPNLVIVATRCKETSKEVFDIIENYFK